MEPQEIPIVEREDDEDQEVIIGREVPDEALTPGEPPDEVPPEVYGVPTRFSSALCIVHENFEDGQYTGSRTQMRVPPRVIEDGGRKFLRITGHSSDKSSIPASFRNRTRSTVAFTSHYSSMPIITPANRKQTYRVDLRVSPHCPHGCSVFELYQMAPGGEGGYGQQNGTGPPIRLFVVKGRMKLECRYDNERKVDLYDLGVVANVWNTYQIDVVWDHNHREGQIKCSVNGKLKHTIRRDPCLGPASYKLPMVKAGLYGDDVTNGGNAHCDVDNLHLYPTGGDIPGGPLVPPEPAPEPEPLPGPRAVNAGGLAYTSTTGMVYAADRRYVGGQKETFTNPIAGTDDPTLYQSWHYGNFKYTAPCPNGKYKVTFRFAENLHTEAGKRVFNVLLEGETVIPRLDVFAKVGGMTAYDVEVPVTVTDKALTATFEKLIGNPMVSAILVEPV